MAARTYHFAHGSDQVALELTPEGHINVLQLAALLHLTPLTMRIDDVARAFDPATGLSYSPLVVEAGRGTEQRPIGVVGDAAPGAWAACRMRRACR